MNLSVWLALFQREWLQHRRGWALLAGLPLVLGWLLVGFGTIELDANEINEHLPMALTLAVMAATTAIYGLLAVGAAAITLAGLARRDHADRSVEFWLSLPTDHPSAWAVPLITHALLVPLLALPVGALAGVLMSPVLVSRMDSLQAWVQLPWAEILPTTAAVLLRLMAGMPLAVLWLAPLLLLMVLLTAWLGRWGLLVLVGVFGVATGVLDKLWGQPWPAQAVAKLFENAALSLMHASSQPEHTPFTAATPLEAIQKIPGVLWPDFQRSLGLLADPALAGVLAVSVACFAGLVFWRRRGAGTMA